ncbi:MAG: twin-arginine translocase subunit TatB [Rhodospirillales bacterium]|nr:twin-arginine translocase subunit TatB [Rhodospirillales bacterium]
MFDIGWQEIFILAVIALIVIGPKDLPRAIRTITKGLRKVRGMARDLQDGMDDVVREAEMEELRNTIGGDGPGLDQQLKDAVDLDFDDLNIEGDLRDEMTGAAEDFKAITDPGASKKRADGDTKAAPKKPKSTKPKPRKSTKTAKATKATKADG